MITSQTLTANTTWTMAGSPYWVQDTLRVGAGVRLTIEPGVVVKIGNPSNSYGSIIVDGQLAALGTSAAPVVFTSHRDDSIAGDTNGDGGATTPARGDWYHIYFSNTATTQSVIDRAVIQYGGQRVSGVCHASATVDVTAQASLSLTNSDLKHAMNSSLSTAPGTGTVRVANNRFSESKCAPLR
ncbi:hypothetical protein [Sinomonas mesophila]|uniref:hypothetical protein n=1 Tax=Sinomonas mesophila TaxID=1531955 RepID=UPI0009870F93|nr:hypothetical protein [Sinomonas mesophila]